jgi:hypothetical protein
MNAATRTRLVLIALVAVLVIAIGRVHVVINGGRLGLTLCSKDSWSLRDTFVNLKDYIDQRVRLQPAKPRVVIALLHCEVARGPGDELDLYWQAIQLTAGELGLRARVEWIGRGLTITGSEDDCERLKPLVIRIAPSGQHTACDSAARRVWSIDR